MPRTSLMFLVDDLEERVEHLKALGVPFDLEPAANGSGARRAVCRDPDANFVVLLSGPRVARKRKDDDGRPSRASRRKAGKKSAQKSTKKSAPKTSKKAKPAKKKAAQKNSKKDKGKKKKKK